MSYYLGLSFFASNSHNQQKENRRKFLSAEARRVLSELAERPLAQDDIARDEQGRPFFPENDGADFSISHSGALAAVSLVRGSKPRTGCDVELVRPRAKMPEIAEKYFCAPERDYIFPRGCLDAQRFFRIWTLKECFIKLRGLSVFDMAAIPSFVNDGDFVLDEASSFSFFQYELRSAAECYILTTAIEGKEEPEIRWFSSDSLECTCIVKINPAK